MDSAANCIPTKVLQPDWNLAKSSMNVEDVERLDYYVTGGYDPVMIGDEFCKGRYVIAHKLGFGRSATTCLAEDKSKGRLVALKISTAESAERTREGQILRD